MLERLRRRLTKDAPAPAATAYATTSDSNLSFAFQVFGTVTLDGDTLTCFRCAATSPWLLCTNGGDAFATCRCGCRNVHPKLTAALVEERSAGAEAVWPSIDAIERGLGFGDGPDPSEAPDEAV